MPIARFFKRHALRLPVRAALLAAFLPASATLLAAQPKPVPLVLDLPTAFDMSIHPVAGQEGTYEINTSGEDPQVLTKPFPPRTDLRKTPVVSFEYFCPDGLSVLQFFIGPPIVSRNLIVDVPLPKAERWMPFSVDMSEALQRDIKDFRFFRIDFGVKPGVKIQIRNLQLRTMTDAERADMEHRRSTWDGKVAKSERYENYLKQDFPVTLAPVGVQDDVVTISGNLGQGGTPVSLFLAEYPLWSSPWLNADEDLLSLTPLSSHLNLTGSAFALSLPRHGANAAGDGTSDIDASAAADRLYSRWAVVRKNREGKLEPLSRAVFAGELDIAPADAPAEVKPKSIKGLAGVFWHSTELMDELVELGVHSGTVNLMLMDFLPVDGQPVIEHTFNGQTWKFNRSKVEYYDRVFRFCTDNDIVVAAILLLSLDSSIVSLDSPRHPLMHPEAVRPGLYSMPNMTNAEGTANYLALLDFVASRYARPDGKYGLISNWIAHNEVDYAWSWTNMGRQPIGLYSDAHTRSLRAIWLTAQKYNPHARVFISLTHNWTTPGRDDGSRYMVRDLMELLAVQSNAEGDFGWGVAYHPYPQSLLAPETWLDKDATFDFDTKYITPKNIEVLDAWMHEPQNRYLGRDVRGVLLSEQGFHTRDYSEEQQLIQAAGLVYTWHKLRPLKSIETYQNHRWIDHPLEGGLKVGLRTLPSEGHDNGERKLAWNTYKILDTPDEAKETEFAKKIIGIKSFDEIPYKGQIGGATQRR